MTKRRRRTTERSSPPQLTTDFTFFPLWSPRAFAYARENFLDFEGAGLRFSQYLGQLSHEIEHVLYDDGVPVVIPLEADEYVSWLSHHRELLDSADARTAFAMEGLECAHVIDSIESFYTIAESEMLSSCALEMLDANVRLMEPEEGDLVFEKANTKCEELADALMEQIRERAPEEVSVEYLAFIEIDGQKEKMSGLVSLYVDDDGEALRFESPEERELVNNVLLVGTVNRCRLIVTCYANGSFGTKFRWKVDRGSISEAVALPFS
jgi:hypothetical protein